MSRLELVGLSKNYRETSAIRDVNLAIAEGQFVCFLGPSGCGKTTLMRVIAGLEQPSSGNVRLNGKDITGEPTHRRNFGMVFQSLALFPHLNVAGNIAYSLKLRGMQRRFREERVAELLTLVDLPHIGSRRVDQLSGGQRQRVAIARALAQEPQLFLMDEPLSALDAKLRDHMQVELRQLQQKLKITTIFVTHDQREAMTIADTIVVMAEGKVQQVGTPIDVYRRPANTFVAGFIGQSNLFPVTVEDGATVNLDGVKCRVNTMSAGLRHGDQATLCVRPEDVLLTSPDGSAGAMLATIDFVREVGSEVELRLRSGDRSILATTTPTQWQQLAGSATLQVGFAPDRSIVLEL
jgi:putative spermidine/putrescine transport system ATP-binding protein